MGNIGGEPFPGQGPVPKPTEARPKAEPATRAEQAFTALHDNPAEDETMDAYVARRAAELKVLEGDKPKFEGRMRLKYKIQIGGRTLLDQALNEGDITPEEEAILKSYLDRGDEDGFFSSLPQFHKPNIRAFDRKFFDQLWEERNKNEDGAPPRVPDGGTRIISPSSFINGPGFEVKQPRTGPGNEFYRRDANDRAKGKLSGLDSKWRQETQEARERLTRNVVKVMRAGLRNPSDVAEAYANEPARTLTPEEIGQLIDEARERGIIDDAGHESLEEEFIPPAGNSSPAPGK